MRVAQALRKVSRHAEGITSEAKDDGFSFSGEDGRGDIRPVFRMQEGLQASWSSVVQGWPASAPQARPLRAESRGRMQKKYFTGKPRPYGHGASLLVFRIR